MTISDLMLQDFDIEVSNTRRTLERVPEGKNDWVPHPKSMPMGKLAMHCATILLFGSYIMDDEGMDLANPRHPHVPLVFASREACLKQLDEAAAKCRSAIVSASDEHFSVPWRFTFGEHLISEAPRSLSFRQMCFNHMVHHAAQLGVYLRLNNLPVPALYGPSADEEWSPVN